MTRLFPVAVLAALLSGCASVEAAPQGKTVPVTVQLSTVQHDAIVWALARPRPSDEVSRRPGEPTVGKATTVEEYATWVVTTATRSLVSAHRQATVKAADITRQELEQRLSKLTVAQCLRLASELAVTTDKLPCGDGRR